MSNTSKAIVWAVVAVAVVAGIWWYVSNSNQGTPVAAPQSASAPAASGGGANAGATNVSGNGSTSPQDTSDAALNQDLSSVDNALNGLASDTSAADQSLNDQPIPQGQ